MHYNKSSLHFAISLGEWKWTLGVLNKCYTWYILDKTLNSIGKFGLQLLLFVCRHVQEAEARFAR